MLKLIFTTSEHPREKKMTVLAHCDTGEEGKWRFGGNNLSSIDNPSKNNQEMVNSSQVIVSIKNETNLSVIGEPDTEIRTNMSEVSTAVVTRKPNGHISTPKSNFIIQYFKKKSQSWSRRQILTILILSFVEFFAAAVVSIQAPFYPDVVRKKTLQQTEPVITTIFFKCVIYHMSTIQKYACAH